MADNEKQFEDFVRGIKFDDTPDRNHRDRLEQDLFTALAKQAPRQIKVRRMIMKSQVSKLTTAAAIILIALLGITFLQKSATPAYAIKQTIEANKAIRYVHLISQTIRNDGLYEEEMWVKLDENGQVLTVRVDKGQHGTVVAEIFFDSYKVKSWEAEKNEFFICYIYGMTPVRNAEDRILLDPRFAVELLYDLQDQGKISIDIEDPSQKTEPIRLIATPSDQFIETKGRDRWIYKRHILLIDPSTKLVQQIESYKYIDGEYVLRRRHKFVGYNDSIDPAIFEIEPPKDAEVIDLTKNIGLPQGSMTDAEAAAEVVRQYIEALIAKDYEKAAKLYNKTTADEKQKRYERLKIKLLRLIAIGDPVPDTDDSPWVYRVPFAYLVETADGKKEIAGPWGGLEWSPEAEANLDMTKLRTAEVRPVVDQPDRWVITGGI